MRISGILRAIAMGAALLLAAPLFPAQQVPPTQPAQGNPQTQPPNVPQSGSRSPFTLKVNSNLVLTNVVVRDKKTGEIVRGLTARDFSVRENGRPQQILSFDFESVDQAAPLNEATISGKSPAAAPSAIMGSINRAATSQELRNHRLIVLFFDLTSMPVADAMRSLNAAGQFAKNQMTAADLVAVVT